MRYFIPDWADTVDPSFDFANDSYGPQRQVSNDVYAHELFSTPPYGGILISRATAEKSPSRYERLLSTGARSFFRLPPSMRAFGDCGAFTYLHETQPRYETEDVLDYYQRIGVNYGASIDHLVIETLKSDSAQPVKMSVHEYERRVELTHENALEFLRLHRRGGYRFHPIGVAQGWNPKTYAQSVRQLISMGYDYVALGGLARAPGETVLKVLERVRKAVDDPRRKTSQEIRIHVFGVAKPGIASRLRRLRISSIDSASYLRKAWLRSAQNYVGPDGVWYTAVRVPQSSHPKVMKYVSHNGKSMAEVQKLEKYCLSVLQEHDASGLPQKRLDRLLGRLVEYDRYLLRIGDDGQQMRDGAVSEERYRRTLEARPWEACPCNVCAALGIQVVIFRGTNRNKRRGFHNTWVLHHRLRGRNLPVRELPEDRPLEPGGQGGNGA
jgi:hypothetical protein